MSSSKVLLSFHYSCAYELDYSFHVIILTYELAYSLYVMILTCSTLCLTIHMTCMSRSRARLRWRFVIPSGLPMFFACRSIGSKSWGIWVVSLYTGMVLGCIGTFGYDGAPDWGVGGRWWQPYPSLIIPMFGYCVGVLKSLALASRPMLRDLPVHLTLSCNSSHISCMIINCSLHSYFWPCLLHLGLFFYSLFSFYPWGWLRCVFIILEIPFLPWS
jgi:hypothetical protein